MGGNNFAEAVRGTTGSANKLFYVSTIVPNAPDHPKPVRLWQPRLGYIVRLRGRRLGRQRRGSA